MKYTRVRKDTTMKKALNRGQNTEQDIGVKPNILTRNKAHIFGIFAFILLMMGIIQIDVLVASNYKTGKQLKAWPIKEGQEFDIEYTHSVQLTPVIERYTVDEGNHILLKESYFHSYGAGLPATTPYEFEITEDGFRIYDMNQVMDNLIYRTGAVKANHRIHIGQKTYFFLDFSEPREGIRFTAEKISLLSYLWRGYNND